MNERSLKCDFCKGPLNAFNPPKQKCSYAVSLFLSSPLPLLPDHLPPQKKKNLEELCYNDMRQPHDAHFTAL